MANMAALTRPLSSFAPSIRNHDAVAELWAVPRGGIAEILGEASSGRTALMQRMLAAATLSGEIAAVIDCDDAFDPASARRAGADLGKLLWVRCEHRLENALKATDLILHGGGFGLVILDLGDAPAAPLDRIPRSYWYRFQRALEPTPSALLILARESVARSCAIRQLGLRQDRLLWRGHAPFRTMDRLELHATSKKPASGAPVRLDVQAEK